MAKFNCRYYQQGFKEGQHMIIFYVNTDFMAKVLTGRGSQYMQECSLMGIKVSQPLSKTLCLIYVTILWNVVLAALDGVIQLARAILSSQSRKFQMVKLLFPCV